MKKGFTLVEIIISIGIILIVGVSATMVIIKNNKNELNNITKDILEASKVYLEKEFDDKGNTYKKGLLSGGTGVVIPLNKLVETGYIGEKTIKTLEDNGIDNHKYILAGVFEDSKEDCGTSDRIIKFEAGWGDKLSAETNTTYLCEYSTGGTSSGEYEKIYNLIEVILNKHKNIQNISEYESPFFSYSDGVPHLDKITNNDYGQKVIYKWPYTIVPGEDQNGNFVWFSEDAYVYANYSKQNGLFERTVYNGEKYITNYYYRGAVNDNYVTFSYPGPQFRIVDFSPEDNYIRLISEKSIEIDMAKSDDEKYIYDELLKQVEMLYLPSFNSLKESPFFNSAIKETRIESKETYYRKVGILSSIDAWYAGIGYIYCNKDGNPGCLNIRGHLGMPYPMYINSYLNEKNDYNSVILEKNGSSISYCELTTISTEESELNYENITGGIKCNGGGSLIRLVISIDADVVKVLEGNGTEDVPYRLNY